MMLVRRSLVGFLVPRLIFAAFCVITSLYCLIAYIPFAYQQIIEFRVISWTGVFARFHPWLCWVASACLVWTLRDDSPGRHSIAALSA